MLCIATQGVIIKQHERRRRDISFQISSGWGANYYWVSPNIRWIDIKSRPTFWEYKSVQRCPVQQCHKTKFWLYILKKNDKFQMIVKCVATNCQWRLHVSKEENINIFPLKTMQATHIWGGGISTTSYLKASKKWICDRAMQNLKEWPLYKLLIYRRTYYMTMVSFAIQACLDGEGSYQGRHSW